MNSGFPYEKMMENAQPSTFVYVVMYVHCTYAVFNNNNW